MEYTEIKEPGIYWARQKSRREYDYLIFVKGVVPFCTWNVIWVTGDNVAYSPYLTELDIGPKIEKPTP